MKKVSFDTNVVLRYLLADNLAQAQRVKEYLYRAKRGDLSIFLSQTVCIELVYVLTRVYHFSRDEVGTKLKGLFDLPFITVEKRDIIRQSLYSWKTNGISFADTLLAVEAACGSMELFTFDIALQSYAAKVKIQ